MTADFADIFRYHDAINKKYFELFDAHKQKVHETSIKLMCHILNAHHIWNARINGIKPDVAVWDVYGIEKYGQLNSDNMLATAKIIAGKNMDEIISYTTAKGDPFRNKVGEILFHVNNHSTHHKAQISSQLKIAGIDPPVTDYIFYKR